MFDPLVALLRDRFRMLIPDLRGHGKSGKPHEQALYGYATLSRDVVHLMDHLGIERADLMGYSMGAFMGAPYDSQACHTDDHACARAHR